jgi:hypothetical protein
MISFFDGFEILINYREVIECFAWLEEVRPWRYSLGVLS